MEIRRFKFRFTVLCNIALVNPATCSITLTCDLATGVLRSRACSDLGSILCHCEDIYDDVWRRAISISSKPSFQRSPSALPA
jgi:hypothetical protein